jgi:Na+/melibiose symporter-like transporter
MTSRQHVAYGLLGAPLAMAALPIYIHTPKLYGDEFGLGLALTGLILLLSRTVDTVQDLWLGRLTDVLQKYSGGWPLLVSISATVLAMAYVALFNPPVNSVFLPFWFGITLVLVYTAHSALNITYLTWGARVSDDTHERTRLVASREGFALAGVVIASMLPMVLVEYFGNRQSWLLFSLVFILFLVLSVWILLRFAPNPVRKESTPQSLLQPLYHTPFRRLAALFFLNGLAIAIAATLSLFYIADVLQLESFSGGLLALYFLSGVFSLPLWLVLSRRFGKTRAWMGGGVLAVIGFVWAVQLGSGDLLPYSIICIFSGAALGADLALPSAIAADIIPVKHRGQTGSYFGIWSLINKGVLALAAGFTLPLLTLFDYQPGQDDGLTALTMIYAGVPCLIKLVFVLLLMRWRSSLEVVHAH